jgi:hypothetical protein
VERDISSQKPLGSHQAFSLSGHFENSLVSELMAFYLPWERELSCQQETRGIGDSDLNPSICGG